MNLMRWSLVVFFGLSAVKVALAEEPEGIRIVAKKMAGPFKSLETWCKARKHKMENYEWAEDAGEMEQKLTCSTAVSPDQIKGLTRIDEPAAPFQSVRLIYVNEQQFEDGKRNYSSTNVRLGIRVAEGWFVSDEIESAEESPKNERVGFEESIAEITVLEFQQFGQTIALRMRNLSRVPARKEEREVVRLTVAGVSSSGRPSTTGPLIVLERNDERDDERDPRMGKGRRKFVADAKVLDGAIVAHVTEGKPIYRRLAHVMNSRYSIVFP
jgi:hypothetical protein